MAMAPPLLLGVEAKQPAQDAVVVDPRRLGTTAKAAGCGCPQRVLDEHAAVEPAALGKTPVDGDDQRNRGTEEFEVAA